MEYKIKKRHNKKFLKDIKTSNAIFYIMELNNFKSKDYKEIFNKVIKMKINKENGDFF